MHVRYSSMRITLADCRLILANVKFPFPPLKANQKQANLFMLNRALFRLCDTMDSGAPLVICFNLQFHINHTLQLYTV